MYEFEVDQDGVLIARNRGCWSLQLAKAYREELMKLLSEQRAQHGQVLLMVDARECAPQPPEVRNFFSDFESDWLSGDRDRSAYVVPSSLAKADARKMIKGEQSQSFLSENAAKTWLLAGRNRGAAAAG